MIIVIGWHNLKVTVTVTMDSWLKGWRVPVVAGHSGYGHYRGQQPEPEYCTTICVRAARSITGAPRRSSESSCITFSDPSQTPRALAASLSQRAPRPRQQPRSSRISTRQPHRCACGAKRQRTTASLSPDPPLLVQDQRVRVRARAARR
eukprot:379819-Rhodomonas_salina.2